MMKIVSEISDSYGLHSLHKKYSKKDQFNYVEKEVSAFNSDFSFLLLMFQNIRKSQINI